MRLSAPGWCELPADVACRLLARGMHSDGARTVPEAIKGALLFMEKVGFVLPAERLSSSAILKKLCESARPRKIWKQELLPPRKLRSGLSCSYLQAIYEIQISNFANGLKIIKKFEPRKSYLKFKF